MEAKARASLTVSKEGGVGFAGVASAMVEYQTGGDGGTALGFTISPAWSANNGMEGFKPMITVMDIDIPVTEDPLEMFRSNLPAVLENLFSAVVNSNALKTYARKTFTNLLQNRNVLGGFFMDEETGGDIQTFLAHAEEIVQGKRGATLTFAASAPMDLLRCVQTAILDAAQWINRATGRRVDLNDKALTVVIKLDAMVDQFMEVVSGLATGLFRDDSFRSVRDYVPAANAHMTRLLHEAREAASASVGSTVGGRPAKKETAGGKTGDINARSFDAVGVGNLLKSFADAVRSFLESPSSTSSEAILKSQVARNPLVRMLLQLGPNAPAVIKATEAVIASGKSAANTTALFFSSVLNNARNQPTASIVAGIKAAGGRIGQALTALSADMDTLDESLGPLASTPEPLAIQAQANKQDTDGETQIGLDTEAGAKMIKFVGNIRPMLRKASKFMKEVPIFVGHVEDLMECAVNKIPRGLKAAGAGIKAAFKTVRAGSKVGEEEMSKISFALGGLQCVDDPLQSLATYAPYSSGSDDVKQLLNTFITAVKALPLISELIGDGFTMWELVKEVISKAQTLWDLMKQGARATAGTIKKFFEDAQGLIQLVSKFSRTLTDFKDHLNRPGTACWCPSGHTRRPTMSRAQRPCSTLACRRFKSWWRSFKSWTPRRQ